MSIYSRKLLEKTITVRQPFSSSILSHEDAREITEDIMGLFSPLSEWENKTKTRRKKNERISVFGMR